MTDAPNWSVLVAAAAELVTSATSEGLAPRVVGSTGIHMHCERAARLLEGVRPTGKDIDVIVQSRERKRLCRLLENLGYTVDRDLLVAMEGMRYCYHHPSTHVDVDVFVDRMEFCHTIDLTGRLNLHPITIPIEDLLLQKLQVHELTRNDVLDASVLLATHEVQEAATSPEQIDGRYIGHLLARDWGFHHTAMANMREIDRTLERDQPDGLGAAGAETARARLSSLRAAIDGTAKSRSWRLRARVGERMQWWEDVDDKRATY